MRTPDAPPQRSPLERAFARIDAAAAAVAGLDGWRRLAVAAAAGAGSVLAFAPLFFVPALFAAVPVLIWLIDGSGGSARPLRRAALDGWAYGFGFFLAGCYWIGFAFLVDAERQAWMLPFAAVLFPGGLALFAAAAAALARALWTPGWPRLFVFAASWSLFEWLRGHILTGFPWNLTGYVWAGGDAVLQAHAALGAYGVSLLTILAAATPAALARGDRPSADGSGPWPRLRPLAVALAGIALAAGAGGWRLAALPQETVPGVALRIVQPNTPQADKYEPALRLANWRKLLELTARDGADTRTLVVWPEAAPPFLLLEQPAALEQIAAVLPRGAQLISGAARRAPGPDGVLFHNSLVVVGADGGVGAIYDKAHLVPFGEYLPFQAFMDRVGITKLTGGKGGFTPGPGLTALPLAAAPAVTPLICYEIVFPGSAVPDGARPGWLVNVTDDSWFGDTSGPRQHLAIARARAVEEGLPVVRAANTGISAVIDAAGRIGPTLDYGVDGVIDAPLPKALPPTLYARLSDWPFAVLLIGVAILGLWQGLWRNR